MHQCALILIHCHYKYEFLLPVSPITGIAVVAGATVVVVEVTAGVAADVVDAPDVGVDDVASVVDAIVVTPTVVAQRNCNRTINLCMTGHSL